MIQKKKNLWKILIKFIKVNNKRKIWNETSIYDSKKEKSLQNTDKLHKNSKTYLDAQNEFTPKLMLSWVVSDPTQTWPAHCEGQAVAGETPFSTEGPLVLKFF